MDTDRKKTILFVDNDRFLCEFATLELKRSGFSVVCAYGGHEAFNMVKSFPIDVIVTALQMTKGSGAELIERVRDLNPKYPGIIAMAEPGVFSEHYDETAAAELRIAAVVSHPPDFRELVDVIDLSMVSQQEEKSYYERISSRQNTSLQAEVLIPGLDKFRLVQVVNLSPGGFGFRLRGALTEVGTVVTFRIHSKDRNLGSIEGFGVVRWTAQDRERPKDLLLGVQFIDLSSPMAKKVSALIAEQDGIKQPARQLKRTG